MSFSPVRLNHAVLYVTELDRSVEFYTDVFGMEVIALEPRMSAAFLRLPRSGNHHDLGLFGLGLGEGGGPGGDREPGGVPIRSRAPGLYHLAWQVETIDELAEARAALSEARSITGESSHGATKSLYGADPDGNEFEIMWMLPREAWGEYETSAVVEPLDLGAEVAKWSGVSTAGSIEVGGAHPNGG